MAWSRIFFALTIFSLSLAVWAFGREAYWSCGAFVATMVASFWASLREEPKE